MTFRAFFTLLLLAHVGTSAASRSRLCRRSAEALISRAPDFSRAKITTSHLYKRHLAEHFCGMGANMTAVELGVYHGYTTSLLANMFKKVIAVDVNKGNIETAAKTLGELEQENVVFLLMDLMADGWSKFASNDVKVVVIDADHTYAGVKRDAGNALRYLPEVQWLVFHDIWMDPVALAVHEFEQQGLLKCTAVGLGFDGSPYAYRVVDEHLPGGVTLIRQKLEGKICRRLLCSEIVQPNFIDQQFMLYRQPISTTKICATGAFRFHANHRLKTAYWKSGSWRYSNYSQARLLVRLPRMAATPLEAHFNLDHNAFLLTYAGHAAAQWFGLSVNYADRPFHVARALF